MEEEEEEEAIAAPACAWSVTPQLTVRVPLLIMLDSPPVIIIQLLLRPWSKLREILGSPSRREWLVRLMMSSTMRASPGLKRHLLRSTWRAVTEQSLLSLLWRAPHVTPELVLRFPTLVVTLRAPPSLKAVSRIKSWRSPIVVKRNDGMTIKKRRGGWERRSRSEDDEGAASSAAAAATTAETMFVLTPPLVSCRRPGAMSSRHRMSLVVNGLVQTVLSYCIIAREINKNTD